MTKYEPIKSRLHGKIGLAIQAMHDGLVKYKDHPNFQIDMSTYGSRKGDICLGCLATVFSQQLAGKDLTPDVASKFIGRAVYLGYDEDDLGDFEFTIDEFRTGTPYPLMEDFYPEMGDSFQRVAQIFEEHEVENFRIEDENYEEYIPKLQALAQALINEDL